jgi:hypothetical protein
MSIVWVSEIHCARDRLLAVFTPKGGRNEPFSPDAVIAGGCALQAQDASPITSNLKQSWANIDNLLTKMADKMPEQEYRFKPVPEVQDFGQRMAHVIGFNMRLCSLLKGEQKNLTFSAACGGPHFLDKKRPLP